MKKVTLGIFNSFGNGAWGKFVDGMGRTDTTPGIHLIDALMVNNAGIEIVTPNIRKELDDWYDQTINSKKKFCRLILAIKRVTPGGSGGFLRPKLPDTVVTGEIYLDMRISEAQAAHGEVVKQTIIVTCTAEMKPFLAKTDIKYAEFATFGGWPGTNEWTTMDLVAFETEYDEVVPVKPSRWRWYVGALLVAVIVAGYFLSVYSVCSAAATIFVLLITHKKWYITLLLGAAITAGLYFLLK